MLLVEKGDLKGRTPSIIRDEDTGVLGSLGGEKASENSLANLRRSF